MQNFISSSMPSSVVIPAFTRSKSHSKVSEHSLGYIPDRFENNSAIPKSARPVSQSSAKMIQLLTPVAQRPRTLNLSRPKTSENNLRGAFSARGASPNTAITVRSSFINSRRSVERQNAEELRDKELYNISIYNSIKQQKHSFFAQASARTAREDERPANQNNSVPIIVQSTDRGFVSARESFRDIKANQEEKSNRKGFGISPRTWLTRQPIKTYQPFIPKLSEKIKEPMKTSIHPKSITSEPIKKRKSRHDRKSTADVIAEEIARQERATMNNIKRRMSEEKAIVEKISEISCGKFYSNLELFNKYYAEYLSDPEIQFMAQGDLRVEVKPFVNESELSQQLKALNQKKRASQAIFNVRGGGNIMSLKHTVNVKNSNGEESAKLMAGIKTISDRTNKDKDKDRNSSSSPTAGKRTVVWAETNEEMECNKVDIVEEGRRKVEQNIEGLKKMAHIIEPKAIMDTEQHAFMRAVKCGFEREVAAMLKKDPELVKATDNTNQTPMHWALKRGFGEIIEMLFDYGADLEAQDITGRSALSIARNHKSREVSNLLDNKVWEFKKKQAQKVEEPLFKIL